MRGDASVTDWSTRFLGDDGTELLRLESFGEAIARDLGSLGDGNAESLATFRAEGFGDADMDLRDGDERA